MWVLIFGVLLIIAIIAGARKSKSWPEMDGTGYYAFLIVGACVALVIIAGILNLLGVFK